MIRHTDYGCIRSFIERLSWHYVAVAFVALLVLYRRVTTERSIAPLVPEPNFQPLKPGESVPSLPLPVADYSRLVDIDNFKFEVNAFPCDKITSLLLVIVVASNPLNFEKRRFIRETWGRSAEATRLVFLLGNSPNAEAANQVTEESATHGDIVRGNFEDAYRNMTYKHVMGMKWVTYHCPVARYILKMDDDAVVNVAQLHHFLASEIGPWGARGLIACQLLENTRVQRSYRSKWRVSPAEYPHHYYPSYCAGWAIIYSADVVRQLYSEAQKAKYFWIDDVHITGVLAERAGIARTSLGNLQLSSAKLKLVTTFHYSPANGVFLFGPPDLSTSLMSDLWNLISDKAEY